MKQFTDLSDRQLDYLEGLVRKCAARGVDPERFVKLAQEGWRKSRAYQTDKPYEPGPLLPTEEAWDYVDPVKYFGRRLGGGWASAMSAAREAQRGQGEGALSAFGRGWSDSGKEIAQMQTPMNAALFGPRPNLAAEARATVGQPATPHRARPYYVSPFDSMPWWYGGTSGSNYGRNMPDTPPTIADMNARIEAARRATHYDQRASAGRSPIPEFKPSDIKPYEYKSTLYRGAANE